MLKDAVHRSFTNRSMKSDSDTERSFRRSSDQNRYVKSMGEPTERKNVRSSCFASIRASLRSPQLDDHELREIQAQKLRDILKNAPEDSSDSDSSLSSSPSSSSFESAPNVEDL